MKYPGHILSIDDMKADDLRDVVLGGQKLKKRGTGPDRRPLKKILDGQGVIYLSQKPSLRTNVSISNATQFLGGAYTELTGTKILDRGDGKTRESLADIVRTCEALMIRFLFARVNDHATLEEMREWAKELSVINALCDEEHPLQILADLLTLLESFPDVLDKRSRKNKKDRYKVAWSGDGSNVAVSTAKACAKLGINFSIASPEQYQIPNEPWEIIEASAAKTGAKVRRVVDPAKAVKKAQAVMTDTWTSMGQEAQNAERLVAFQPYSVTEELMALADRIAIFMHCLPAHDNEEVATSVKEGPQSVIFPEAGNRLWTTASLMKYLQKLQQKKRKQR